MSRNTPNVKFLRTPNYTLILLLTLYQQKVHAMTLKDVFDKKIGDLTVREFLAFDSYLNDKHKVCDTEWITIDEAASLMRRSRRSFEKDYINKVTSTKIGGRRLINKESVIRIIENK